MEEGKGEGRRGERVRRYYGFGTGNTGIEGL